jgi:hypothetical protein
VLATILSWFGNTPRRPARKARLSVEGLEERRVPAGLSANLEAGGILHVVGTDNADTIRVHNTSKGISVEGVFIVKPGETTTQSIGGLQVTTSSISAVRYLAESEVKRIVVDGRGGGDVIDLRSIAYADSRRINIRATIDGGSGDDYIWGTNAGDTIESGGGDDRVWGMGGADFIYVTAGRDRVVGGGGNDTIFATLNIHQLEKGGTGRLFYDDSFTAGNGTDTLKITLDLDSFRDDLFSPVVANLKAATHTFDPVLDALDRKVPVLSKFDSNLTFRSALKRLAPKFSDFVDAVYKVRDLSDAASGLKGDVTLGTFTITTGAFPQIRTVSSLGAGTLNSKAFKAARSAGVKFNLIDDPQSAVRMFMGQNITLVSLRLDLPRVEAGITRSYSAPTGIPGVNVEGDLGGKVFVKAGATFGLDVKGIRNGNLIEGFYIKDASATIGAEATVKGGVAVGVPNVISIASVKGYGKATGSVKFSLAGGDKVYFNDLPNDYRDSFETSGEIGYDVGVEIKYSEWKTSYYRGIPYPEWVGKTITKSLAHGSFTV